jgi:hypothetical protein
MLLVLRFGHTMIIAVIIGVLLWGNVVPGEFTMFGDNLKKRPKRFSNYILLQHSSVPLPAMANVPDSISDIVPVIWAVVPLEKSCMVGFSVADISDNYEIEYKRENENPQTVQITGLRGAAKVYNLNPGEYSFRIRRISDGVSGEWSAVYSERIH